MSRTYRKNSRSHNWGTEQLEIERELAWFARCKTKRMKIRKTQEEYENDVREGNLKAERLKTQAKREYGDRLLWPGHVRWEIYLCEIVRKYKWIDIELTQDQVVEDAKKKASTFSRDGAFSQTSQSTGFKKKAGRQVRLENKRFCQRVLKDDDWENDPYPSVHLGDKFLWDFW